MRIEIIKTLKELISDMGNNNASVEDFNIEIKNDFIDNINGEKAKVGHSFKIIINGYVKSN